MPSLIRPILPPEVEEAIGLMGNRARVEILRRLSMLGPSTIGRLQAAVDISRPSLNRHLDILAQAGLVLTDPPAGMRHGKDVVYVVQSARVRELTKQYASYVVGA
ncbi:ArsR/SmtB family transcription factor [Pseudarthrobacter raffinosi]|uniref:ArsR/SmtB family transcription factor n=1 Tax=Pseudarthrobacter raffinosi TaxID=2953651 RepID=UPI00208FC0EF|nr:helix-turn-helix domain-containing protein [Pseudarthrobacter sp. MDT3-9]MCO4252172.1 helix-turn-helix domain-containing protein [Pseudarthrobacter sp. MDT3-9]